MRIDTDQPPLGVPCWEVWVTYWDADPAAAPDSRTVGYYDSEQSAKAAERAAMRGKTPIYSPDHRQSSVWESSVRAGRFVEDAPYAYIFEPDDDA